MAVAPTAPTAENGKAKTDRERRASPRFRLVQRCLVRPEGAATGLDWHGIIYDVSATGIGLSLPYPVQPGTLLVVETYDLPQMRRFETRVVRTAIVSFQWFCGCELVTKLSDAELQNWLGQPKRGK